MKIVLFALPALLLVSACGAAGNRTFGDKTVSVIARPVDTAVGNRGTLQGKKFAIAILPDGCQAWVGDDGVEGYATNRFDPVSGKPVCSEGLPTGAVIGDIFTDENGHKSFNLTP